ncbi:MAG: FG-GAP-like repeat-containing protein [Oscillospiraceae bacterium]|nr:FG-GAP-like repeat-containing protein [Oscillospiraceae bacterium]
MIQLKKLWVLLLPLLLSGCMVSASAEDLYALPKLPEVYEALSVRLSEVTAEGAEYAPPQAGGNLPPVQMVDLNGDGSDEALAFFRISSEERPLKIYIFRAVGDGYEQAGVISGSGTSIHSIRYTDMDGDGVQEIIVSWSVSTEIQALAVYALENLEPVQLMSTSYSRYEVIDLDGDSEAELVVLRSDETETGVGLAEYYDWDSSNSSLYLQSSARLSVPVGALQWMQVGNLQHGEAAVFVTGRDTGIDETSRAVTDILVYRAPELTNIVMSSDTGVSTQIFRYINLQPADINGDGAMEVPMPAQLPSDSGEDPYWKIYWHNYDLNGGSQLQAITYHNLTDNWYILIPESWDGHFTVRQNNTSSAVHSTTFYSSFMRTVGDELMTIYTLTGTDREAQASKNGRSILRRQVKPDTIYAVTYGDAYESWRYAVADEVIAENFKVIVSHWSMGEN